MPRPKKQPIVAPKFAGFPRPRSNYFKLPNDWPKITASIDSLAELKVVEYVLRHTWGWHEFGILKHITLDEFANGRVKSNGERMDLGTGLSKRGVQDGLARAVKDGYLLEYVDETDKARVKCYYGLPMLPEEGGGEYGDPDIPPSGSRHGATVQVQWQTLPPSRQTNSVSVQPEAQTLPPSMANSAPSTANCANRTQKETLETKQKKETPRGAPNVAPSRARPKKDVNRMSPEEEREYRLRGPYGHLVQH